MISSLHRHYRSHFPNVDIADIVDKAMSTMLITHRVYIVIIVFISHMLKLLTL